MSVGKHRLASATAADLLAIREEEHFHEITGGEMVRKAMPTGPHGLGQSQIVSQVGGPLNRRPGDSGRKAGKKVTQGGLDKKDGEAYFLLEAIVDAFEKAHDIDPTLPRLVPISMRRHFGKHARKAPAAAAEPPVA